MLPYIHLWHLNVPTFGLMLWVAAVAACWVMHKTVVRTGRRDVDSMGVVMVATIAGIIGSKLWHVLESPHELMAHPAQMIFDSAGFAWYGGLVLGILALLIQGKVYKLGALHMLDLAAPAAAVGYALGRLGCLTSGDGDYGVPTSLPWGMSFPHGLVPTADRVHPTPIYELLIGLVIGWILWKRLAKPRPVGEVTGEYLILSGIARFLVEFIRINPRIYWGMSNAQVASLGSILFGVLLAGWAMKRAKYPEAPQAPSTAKEAAAQ